MPWWYGVSIGIWIGYGADSGWTDGRGRKSLGRGLPLGTLFGVSEGTRNWDWGLGCR